MNKKIAIITIVMMLILLLIIPNNSLAIDTSKYQEIYSPSSTNTDTLMNIGGKILGLIQVAGTGIAVIMLLVIGVKYILASVQEKAQLKETLVPYVIGAILLFGGSNLLSIVYKFIKSLYD